LARRRQTEPEVPMTEALKSCPQMTVIAPRKSVFKEKSAFTTVFTSRHVDNLLFIL